MRRLIAISRVAALVGMTAVLAGGLACLRVLRVDRPEAAGHRTDRFVQRWARAARRVIGMRIRVDGTLPGGPVALVANHLSYVDIIALWCVIPGVFVARADVASWTLIGQAGRLVGTVFVDRKRKRDLLRVIEEMEAPLREGRNVIFFPEGTSSRGERVLPFKSSLFEPAARHAIPIVGASLQFETAPAEKSADWSVCWWGDMTFGPHAFALLHQPGFEARIRFSSPLRLEPGTDGSSFSAPSIPAPAREGNARGARGSDLRHAPGKDRKQLCCLAQESVEKLFVPTAAARDAVPRTDAGQRP